jgi:beta-galactosidase
MRWKDVIYEPGELKVIAYRNGEEWATDVMKTSGAPVALGIAADRSKILSDGADLSFVTVTVVDQEGNLVPRSKNHIRFTIDGPGEIVATDNGDPTSHVPFQSAERDAFNGMCLAVVRAKQGETGVITLRAESGGLEDSEVEIAIDAAVR